MKRWGPPIFALAVASLGCISPKGFRCTASSQCGGGQCEATGYCSVVATECATGRRYVAEAGLLASQCVGNGNGSGCLVSFGAGGSHACVAKGNGESHCWGSNDSGQLGNTSTMFEVRPSRVASPEPFVQIALGMSHTCARNAEGKVWCWGNNSSFETGTATGETVVIPSPAQTVTGGQLTGVAELQLGDDFSCARMQEGTVQCWGDNARGQLGDGATSRRAGAKPVLLDGTQTPLRDVTALATGTSHACALSNGVPHCWGDGSSLQLGNGAADSRTGAVPVRGPGGVGTLTDTVAIAAGARHSCALRRDGTAWCWGGNGFGQLGVGDTTMRDAPTQVALPKPGRALFADTYQTCALLVDRTAACWGGGAGGQLGVGDGNATERVVTPAALRKDDGGPLEGIAEIGLGVTFGCARLESDGLVCWGDGSSGQLADGHTRYDFAPPTTVTDASGAPFLGAVRLVTGVASTSTCALKADKTAWCWGQNQEGQLGTGDTTTRAHPVRTLLENIEQLSFGVYFACARTSAGTISCWGNNTYGQLARDPAGTPYSATPLIVSSSGNPTGVSTGAFHACSLAQAGTVSCWGYNVDQQLGYTSPNSVSYSFVPTAVAGLSGTTTQISMGRASSCAALADGTAWCWGVLGELGGGWDSFTASRLAPGPVNGNPGASDAQTLVSRLESGSGHHCLIRSTGEVRCWGSNGDGELGDGTTTWGTFPRTAGLTSPTRLSLGSFHTCAVAQNGALFCWGRNASGQLGLSSGTYRPSPVEIMPAGSVTDVAAGNDHTCALKTDGTIVCFGSFYVGQLGDGRASSAPFARSVAGVCP